MCPNYKGKLPAVILLMLLGNKSIGQNVGIGTATPAQKLHVAGAGQTIRVDGLSGVGTRAVYANNNGDLTTLAGSPAPEWLIIGNSGTTAAANFIGTIDPVDFVVRTNNTEQMRVTSTGNIGVGIAAPLAKLHVQTSAGVAIRGSQTGFGSGYLGFGGAISLGSFGSTPGAVIYSEEGTATTNPSLIAVTRNPAIYAANISYSDVWIAGYFGVDNSSVATNTPLAIYGQLNMNANWVGPPNPVFQTAVQGYMNRGAIAGNGAYSVGLAGISSSANQDAIGVLGRTYCNNTLTVNSGGYFESNTYAGANNGFAYVANTTLNRKIAGSGAVSEIIPTADHGRIILTCPESPEYWYQDYGTVQLVNGKAHVDLDPILADIIIVNNDNPIRAFCTPVDMPSFNGISISNRTEKGFDIIELNGGTHSGTLEYQVVVKPKTNYGEGRFMQAPGPLGLKPEMEPAKAKAKNQPDISKIWRWPSDNVVYGYTIPRQEPMPVKKEASKK
jgi:hypothetical protein